MGHSVNGRNLCGLIAVYMVIKGILNLILGFGVTNIIALGVSVFLGYCLIMGFKYMNLFTAGFLIALVVFNIKDNITEIGLNRHLIYLVEAVIDVVCAYKLLFNEDIKEHFRKS
ncbi:MAG: hypothetical protein IKP95_10410 [Ruminococcus sp.]|nr:hypothetical protein [Ruminococcus sp.]